MERSDSTEVAAHLVDVVLGGTTRAAHAAERIGTLGGWHAALALAARWHVLPTLAMQAGTFDRTAARMERAVESSLRAQTAIAAVRSAAALRDAAVVLRELAEADVPAAAFKGIATITTLYRSTASRMVSDVDIVICPGDLVKARAALASLGYLDRSPPNLADIALMRTLHNFSGTYVRDGFEIDVHWQFGPRPPSGLSADRILERSVLVGLDGQELRVAGPIETALLTVHHALRSEFRASTTVKDLLDLARWWARHGGTKSNELVAAACESGLASSLLALSLAIAKRNPAHGSGTGIGTLERCLGRSGRAQARALLASFDNTVGGKTPDSATLALFAPKVYARSVWGTARRAIASKAGRAVPDATKVAGQREPVFVRAQRCLSRSWRIGRELAQLKRIATYRAVARAQSRFH